MGMTAEDLMRDRLSETGPADTPAPAEKPTGTAAPAGDTRKYAGKFDSVEALEASYAEAQRKITEESEARKRLEALMLTGQFGTPTTNAGYVPTAAANPDLWTPSVTGSETDFVSRAEAQRLAQDAASRAVAAETAKAAEQQKLSTQQQYWRDEFYRRHPDLKDDLLVVQGATGQVLARYQHHHPDYVRAMLPTVLDEIATAARERIAGYMQRGRMDAERASAAITAAASPGASGPVGAGSPAPAKEKTLDEQRADTIREEMEQKMRMRVQPRGPSV